MKTIAILLVSQMGLGLQADRAHAATGLSLEELKAKCHEKESDAQVMKFSSSFECSEERTFWVHKGDKRFVLENQASIKIKALIKDDRHQTDWWEVPGPTDTHEAMCPVLEQWKVMARYQGNIKSCEQLDNITTEEAYCREKLATVWAECDVERQQAQSKLGDFVLPKAPLCEYESTGIVKSCTEEGPVTPTQQKGDSCTQQQQDVGLCGVETCVQQHNGTVQCSLQSSVAQNQAAEFELGASIRMITVKRNLWHRNHKVVLIDSPVLENSLLDKLGVKQGDMISRVNDRRTKDVHAFWKYLKAAASGSHRSHKVKFEYRGHDTHEKFVDKLMTF